MVLDAFEAAIGPTGPNPLHHRIEHALQVTDDQLAGIVTLDLAAVVQLDGAAVHWVLWAASQEDESGRDYQSEDVSWLARWRDFVDAGLHFAATSDAPWFFPDLVPTDDIGRPVDEIAGGMDGRAREYSDMPEWMLDQLLTAEQGLSAVTVDAAHALGDEMRRGRLAPGTLGDVTILSGDVISATPARSDPSRSSRRSWTAWSSTMPNPRSAEVTERPDRAFWTPGWTGSRHRAAGVDTGDGGWGRHSRPLGPMTGRAAVSTA